MMTSTHAQTLAPLARRFTTSRLQRGQIRPATAAVERNVLRRLSDHFGARQVDALTPTFALDWIATLGVSANSRASYYSICRRFARWLVAERHLRRDPFAGAPALRVPKRAPRALGRDDVDALMSAARLDRRARVVFALALDLGLRVGEIARLELGSIDMSARTVHIVGKGGHERLIPITPRAIAEIAAYHDSLGLRARSGPVVRSAVDPHVGITAAYLSVCVSQWMTAAGVKRAPWDGRSTHAMRHTCASEIADVEPDLRVVQALLGHSSIATTQVYLRALDVSSIRAAMERRAA